MADLDQEVLLIGDEDTLVAETSHNPLETVVPTWVEDYEATDEDWEADEEGFGSLPPEWVSIWAHLRQILDEFGFTPARLATQDGEEPMLLTQLLEQGGYNISKLARDWLMQQLLKLVGVSLEAAGRAKRFKGSGNNLHMQRLIDSRSQVWGALDEEMGAPELFFKPAKGTRPFRGGRLLLESAGSTREAREREELKRWKDVLVRKLIEARTPAFLQAETAADPLAALERSIGSTRVSTLKTYIKRWQQLEVWCRRSYGLPWPTEVGQILDYIEVLAEDVKPSVPQQVLQAFQWMEKTAGWTGDDRLMANSLVLRAFENLIVQAGSELQAKKQSPRFPFVLLASLELFCQKPGLPIMRKIHAKSLLFRSYGTCRFDDLQNINPDKLRKVGGLVVTELLRSKTTGAGKRNRELPMAVSVEASLLGTDWLLSFLEDLEETKKGPRDYLLQNSTFDGAEAKNTEKSYTDSAAETKWILGQLRLPTLKDGKWTESEELLLPVSCIAGFSEHSGRSVMPSAAVAVEPEKTKRDMLGKWLLGGGSVDYTRTFRSVVSKMQKDIVKAVCT